MTRAWPVLAIALGLAIRGPAAADGDLFEFFAAEARVVSASQQPVPLPLAPATVHVVTADDIAASGAQSLWDALRMAPGVDVAIVQTFQGEVGLRGLSKALNNRVLVLLDGKSVLSGYFDRVAWEYLPVGLLEIDRIEVVLGPSSALYGANAVSGVINVITRDPAQLQGLRARLAGGEYSTLLGDVLYGAGSDDLAGHVGLGWRATNRFEADDDAASRTARAHGRLRYAPRDDLAVTLQGGFSEVDSRQHIGGLGSMFEAGPQGYLRADLERGASRVRASWNRNRTDINNGSQDIAFDLDHDRFEVDVEHALELTGARSLTAAASLRYDRVRSAPLRAGTHTATLEGLSLEYQWLARRRLLVVLSGRADHHPETGWEPSPRASLVWSPAGDHVLRASIATSFRFPTVTESRMDFAQVVALQDISNLPFDAVDLRITSNRDLAPERMRMAEVAYTGRRSHVSYGVTGWCYRLQDVIATTPPELEFGGDIPISRISFENRRRDVTGWGGKADLRAQLTASLRARLNYAYQDLDARADPLVATDGGPPHKVNGMLGWTDGPWRANLGAHYVHGTEWYANALAPSRRSTAKLDAYTTIDANLERDLADGWVLSLGAFNLLDEAHHEVLPVLGDERLGQSGKIVRRRLTLTLSYRL